MGVTFAIPPITTFSDAQVAGKTFRAAVGATGVAVALPGLVGITSLLLFHAAVDALVTTMSVEKLRTGAVSAVGGPASRSRDPHRPRRSG